MFNWLSKSSPIDNPLRVDMHSHFLPGIDDGAQTFDDSITLIQAMRTLGYEKIITTPHVISDTFRNTPEIIISKCASVNQALRERGIDFQIEAAAEYYLDEALIEKMNNNERLLTFGKSYLLFEMNFITEPFSLKEFIFNASTRGYRLILAHPERYLFLQQNRSKLTDLIDRGVLFQVNLMSLTGHYSRPAQKLAEYLIDQKMVHWLGSDCHAAVHLDLIKQSFSTKYFRKALSLPLLNPSLA